MTDLIWQQPWIGHGLDAAAVTAEVQRVLAEQARAVLEPMAGKVVHCGAAGAGQAAKLCNNMVLAVQQIAVGEAFVLAEKLGARKGHALVVTLDSAGLRQSFIEDGKLRSIELLTRP